MIKHLTLAFALLLTAEIQADSSITNAADLDGFTRPLAGLKFNPGLDQREFESSTLDALGIDDPLEPLNRRVYHFNYRFDQWVLLPMVDSYHYLTPRFVRSGVSNFFNNLGDIPNLLNSLLQLRGKRSMENTARLLLNTTLGVAGVWDPATEMGLRRQNEDFGQTLGFYGVPGGAYLVLPVFGPSNLRDTTGLAFDIAAVQKIDVLNISTTSKNYPEIWVLQIIDTRDKVNFRYGQLNSPFEYEKVRYIYTKAREMKIAILHTEEPEP